ncbi:hypothetical protein FXO38_29743 [Capsicum annuum]|nr:hypothetical protein FXO38_29743 [Capsicum annuum]KAF3626805.1 hypothetical protein FXO37_30206 [Capsicum annuum]
MKCMDPSSKRGPTATVVASIVAAAAASITVAATHATHTAIATSTSTTVTVLAATATAIVVTATTAASIIATASTATVVVATVATVVASTAVTAPATATPTTPTTTTPTSTPSNDTAISTSVTVTIIAAAATAPATTVAASTLTATTAWICLELLLSIPKHALKSGFHLRKRNLYFSDTALIWTFDDIVDRRFCSADANGCQINHVAVSFKKERFDGLYLSWHRHPGCLTAPGEFAPLSVRGLTMPKKGDSFVRATKMSLIDDRQGSLKSLAWGRFLPLERVRHLTYSSLQSFINNSAMNSDGLA